MLIGLMIAGFVLGGLLVAVTGTFDHEFLILGAMSGSIMGAAIAIYNEVKKINKD